MCLRPMPLAGSARSQWDVDVMRYSAEHKAASRDALLQAAARQFRERGYEGVGVDQLSKAAGVTSGSFYKHFGTKAEILREVARAGVDRVAARIRNLRSSPTVDKKGGWLNDLASLHTSADHLREVGRGCNLPALTPEIARADGEVKQAYQESVERAVEAMLETEPFAEVPEGRQKALAILALLAGGANMARAMADEKMAAEVAETVRRACLSMAEHPLSTVARSGVVWTPAPY